MGVMKQELSCITIGEIAARVDCRRLIRFGSANTISSNRSFGPPNMEVCYGPFVFLKTSGGNRQFSAFSTNVY
ncbi:hypothetical protein DSM14862_01293 [Sulfitobacter indolifex]|nr:hypothetical protein DSM14862_01293 [Sulfitobacter indolifex]